jgi:phosphoribosylformylglycinamidine synthase
VETALRDDVLLFSESAGRFIVTIAPDHQKRFEEIFRGTPFAPIGRVVQSPDFIIRSSAAQPIIQCTVDQLKTAWKMPFGAMI